MSNLNHKDRMKLERILQMSGGYVLDFTNRSFQEFIQHSTGKNIYSEQYSVKGDSKANRLRTFWDVETNHTVGKLLGDIHECWHELSAADEATRPPGMLIDIANRLKSTPDIPDVGVMINEDDDQDLESLVASIKSSIERDEPEHGLDRLHTYLMKYFRRLCTRYQISYDKNVPLHSLVGTYIKHIKSKGFIESEMTEHILKSCIKNFESFNKVRNDQSLAHDNKLLNRSESMLIISYVASTIKFINELEQTMHS